MLVIVRLPPACEMPPPPNVPRPVAELPEITQFVTDIVLSIEPEMMPPPPTAVVSFPPVMVTPEMSKLKFASRIWIHFNNAIIRLSLLNYCRS